MNLKRNSVAIVMALSIVAAFATPALAKGGKAGHSLKAPKAPKAETTKAPAAKKAAAFDFSAIRVDHI